MKKYLFIFIFLFNALFADDEVYDSKAGKDRDQIIDQRENYFQTSTPYKIAPKVNPITGDLIEEETDLIVAGSEPLSVRRFYNHSAIYEHRTGGWRYNPEFFFVANLEWPLQETFAAVGEFSGNITSLKPSANTCTFSLSKGFSHFEPNGQTHPLNTKINYCRVPGKNKHYFSWRGEIIDGSGTRRSFDSGEHCWLSFLTTDIRHGRGCIYVTMYSPNCWTPYQFHVYEERKPNGNVICYSTTRWVDRKYYPAPPLLSGITAYNADKTKVLGQITFHYNQDKNGNVCSFMATGSDGRQVGYQQIGRAPFPLYAAYTPNKPPIGYGYQGTWVNRAEKPEGRLVTTEYSGDKVSAQYAPVGPNGEMHPIGRYIYHDGHTEVYDAEGNKTVYRFNEHKQLLSLEAYLDGKPYCIDRFTWDSSTGNLLKKTIEDGAGKILQIKEYAYDKNHNPIVEKVGDGKEWRTIQRTFSDDGFNLKLSETDRDGKLTRYRYVPNTNLLSSEITYEGRNPKKRKFHFYDDCAVCVKTIIDDGSTEDPSNLQGVSQRVITNILPKQTMPCFGLPEVVEEKTIDSSGNEILMHKTVYTYTPFGKVLKEDHYDANGIYCYSITNAYDDRERLSSQIDPLGHKKSFGYDVNHNLVALHGPKSGQYKEITYDKADRPIRIADWQSDGTVLITEKKYDKLGRLIEETDPCGHKTYFQYDALNRLVATIHPDAAIERKEYDSLSNLIKEIDSEGYETCKTYNCFGQVLTIHYPDGSFEEFTYNPTGTLATERDKNGAISHYVYDVFDHLVKTEIYSSAGKLLKTTFATWTPFNKISETDGDLTIRYTYDFAGRKIGEQKSYREIYYHLDSLGRIKATQEGNVQTIEEHDALNQITEKRKETPGALQFQEHYAYDENGNLTQVIQSTGVSTTLYNTEDQPISFQDPLGFTTQYLYSYKGAFTKTTIHPKGIKTLVTHDSRERERTCIKLDRNNQVIQQYENVYDKKGNKTAIIHTIFSGIKPIHTITHKWEYGPMGRVERFVEAGMRETRYLYDEKGRLQTVSKPNGKTLSHEYDDLGRLVRFFSKEFDYEYIYDLNDRLVSIYDAVSKTRTQRTYDSLGNLLEERLANNLTLKNIYDEMGRRIACTLPDSSSIDYVYEGCNLYQVKRESYTQTYSKRNLQGEIMEALLPDTEKLSIERDKLGRYAAFKTPYYTASYPQQAYDGHGNLLCYHFQDTLGEADYLFTYDDLDQIVEEPNHTYRFDSLYNRLKKDDVAYELDVFCQVNGDGLSTYEYDACGNLIFDGTSKYAYDSLDRLVAVEQGKQRIEYAYDPFNRRLSKTIFSCGKQISRERYLWDDENEIGLVDEKNRIQELRILGEGLGAEIGAAVLYEIKGKPYMPIHDHRGCLVVLVDLKTKKPLESYRYSAFGEELTGNAFSPWRFASKRVDAETALIFFGKRYYNPSLGRFITQDPQGFNDGPNLYAYLKNCPMADFDPYGLFSWGGMWNGTKDYFYDGSSYLWNNYVWGGISGLGRGMCSMGEWMHADYQYEYFNDRSFFQSKSTRAVEGWRNVGRAAWDDPFGMLAPGLAEAWHNPTSPGAWGKATVDIGLMGLSAFKLGSSIANMGRAGRIGEELNGWGKIESFGSLPKEVSRIDPNKLHHLFGQEKHMLHPLVNKFGGNQDKAYRAIDRAAQKAFKEGRLNLKNGINTQTRINVNGIEVDLIGGRVINDRFEIGSVSRRGIR